MIHMRRFILLAGLLCTAMVAGRVSAEMREFATKDGQVIYGELQSYNLKTDKVQFKTDRGKRVQFKAATLLDEDFIYVRDWDAARLFSENNHFRIYLDGPESKNKWSKYLWRRRPGKREATQTYTIDFNKMGYTIKFENKTGYDLENVAIKYCIYYEQEHFDHTIEEKVADLVVRPSLHTYAIIPDGQNKRFESNAVVLRKKEHMPPAKGNVMRYLEGDGRFLKSQMIGMVFRVSITTLSGQTAVREVRVPRDLSEEYVWLEPTEANTAWPDDDLEEIEDTQRPQTQFELEGGSEDEDED